MTARVAHAKKDAFLRFFREEGVISHAARRAQVGRRTVYDWLDNDPGFKEQFADAEQEGIDSLEREAHRRAIAGSDTLLIFLLKAAKPAKYRERVDVNLDVRNAIDRFAESPAEKAAAMEEVNRILAESR